VLHNRTLCLNQTFGSRQRYFRGCAPISLRRKVFEALAPGSLKTEYLHVFRERQSCLVGYPFSPVGVAQPGSKSETLPFSSQKGPLRRISFRKKRFFFALCRNIHLASLRNNAPARHSHI